MSKSNLNSIPSESLAALELAYQQTIYEVFSEDQVIHLQVNVKAPQLDYLLQQHQQTSWAFITAHNPFSQLLTSAENKRRNQTLTVELERRKFTYLKGLGRDVDGHWPPEDSYFVLGISREEAMEVGQAFSQNALLYGEQGQVPQLVWLVN